MRPTEAKNSQLWWQRGSSLYSCSHSCEQTKDKHIILYSLLLKESKIEPFYLVDILYILGYSNYCSSDCFLSWTWTWELQLLSLLSLRATECEISPSLDINTLLCKKGILCGGLEGRDRGTLLFTAKQNCGWLCRKGSDWVTYQLWIFFSPAFRVIWRIRLQTFNSSTTLITSCKNLRSNPQRNSLNSRRFDLFPNTNLL